MDFDTMVEKLFKRTGFDPRLEQIMHAAIGVAGEAGEVLDLVKKSWANGKSLDLNKLIEEMGDLEFYMEALRQAIDVHRHTILARNMAKLAKRYPEGYSDAAAAARLDRTAK